MDTPSRCYAHSLIGQPVERWEPLEDHLRSVATRAEELAGKWNAGGWGRIAGLWHDLGKYNPAFQQRLVGSREHAQHAGYGAMLIVD